MLHSCDACQGKKISPEFLVLWEDADLNTKYTGHRWPGRAAEAVELTLTTLIFDALDKAASMGSQYGDACSGGGADNGELQMSAYLCMLSSI